MIGAEQSDPSDITRPTIEGLFLNQIRGITLRANKCE